MMKVGLFQKFAGEHGLKFEIGSEQWWIVVNKNEISKSRVVYGSHMRDSTAYSVTLGVTKRRNHGMEDSAGMDHRQGTVQL